MQASTKNEIEVAKVLMEARADPFLRDNEVIYFQFFHYFSCL